MEERTHSYDERMLISIWAYYEGGHKSTYYRVMKIADLPKWLDAHTLTHPNCIGYTVKVDDPERLPF